MGMQSDGNRVKMGKGGRRRAKDCEGGFGKSTRLIPRSQAPTRASLRSAIGSNSMIRCSYLLPEVPTRVACGGG